jgi:hypothetical protein
MKVIHEEIDSCAKCPYLVNFATGCPECGGGQDFAFFCTKIEDSKLVACDDDRSLIKREWREGQFNNIIRMEIQIPNWCPLPNKGV